MFSKAKVTEIYCLADDFCKEFARHQENYMLKNTNKNVKHRNKPNRMSDAEIMIIMILFHSGGYRCFKHFYLEYVFKHLARRNKLLLIMSRTNSFIPLLRWLEMTKNLT